MYKCPQCGHQQHKVNFADKIKHYRASNNMTQKELGDKLSVAQLTIARWESGASVPRMYFRKELERLQVV